MFPNTSGAAIDRAERISAAFQGAIAATTPTATPAAVEPMDAGSATADLLNLLTGRACMTSSRARPSENDEGGESE